MEKISYKLPAFEGPLDLLLHLISRNKLNIYDIQISELLEQYMYYIEAMKHQDMDLASEFLEMAARLVHMKTVSLLPKHEEIEELKKELTGQLLEYSECKRIAAIMSEKISFDVFTREPEDCEFDMTYKRKHKLKELMNAYVCATGKGKRKAPPSVETFTAIVSRKIVSVGTKIIYVLRMLWTKKEVCYNKLFNNSKSKSDMVATFLAVLELIKGKRLRVEEEDSQLKVKLIKGGANSWKLKNSNRQ